MNKRIFYACVSLSVLILLLGSSFLYFNGDFLTGNLIFNTKSSSSNRIIPLSSTGSCTLTKGNVNTPNTVTVKSISGRTQIFQDMCDKTNPDYLIKYSCNGKVSKSTKQLCAYGCKKGVCKPKPVCNAQYLCRDSTPECAESKTAQLYTADKGAVTSSSGLGVGYTFIGANEFIRVESIKDGLTILSIWTKDPKRNALSCRLFDIMRIYGQQKLSIIVGNNFITFYTIDDKVFFNEYTGLKAYPACQKFSLHPLMDCIVLPGSGSYTMSYGNFRRVFKNPDYSPAETLLLDSNNYGYNKLISIFPSIKNTYIPTGLWKITEFTRDDFPFFVDGATQYGFIYSFADISNFHEPLSTPGVSAYDWGVQDESYKIISAYDYACKGVDNSVGWVTGPGMEKHELSHAIFWSTQRQSFADSNYSLLISEGGASYIQHKLIATKESMEDWRDIYCGETTWKPTGETYASGHESNGYAVGVCFHMIVEKACGEQALNSAFEKILDQPYHAQDDYPHYFKIIRDYCPDKTRYDEILKNFGIDDYVLTNERPLMQGLQPGNACI